MADADRDKRPADPSGTAQPDPEREHMRRLQRDRRRKVIKAAAILLIVILLVVFVIRNADPVRIDYVFFTRESRLIYVLLVTAFLGGVVGYLLGRPGKGTRLHEEEKKRP